MKVSVIGAGLIGSRRAKVAMEYGDSVVSVFDTDSSRSSKLADEIGAEKADSIESAVIAADIVVVATPNKYLLPVAQVSMESSKHVLIEKPMGRNRQEASDLAEIHKKNPSCIFKIGFNHRYHPAVSAAHSIVHNGTIGKIRFIRAIYGHGGRPGYEREWRGNMDLAGGGELTDQGVHILDLVCWFLSRPDWTFAQSRTYVWPLDNLEDNGFITLGWDNGQLAQIHTSWTQWKNRFAFHVYGTNGAVEVEGLGKSYGPETMTVYRRKPEGGAPEIENKSYPDNDVSWQEEWKDFRHSIDNNAPCMGSASEGLEVMSTLDAIYRSCKSNSKEIV